MFDCSKIPYKDKGCHMVAGFVIALIVGLIAYYLGFEYPQSYSVTTAVVAGIAKEAFDYRSYGVFDGFDMFSTFVGGFFGGLAVVILL